MNPVAYTEEEAEGLFLAQTRDRGGCLNVRRQQHLFCSQSVFSRLTTRAGRLQLQTHTDSRDWLNGGTLLLRTSSAADTHTQTAETG